MKINRKLLVAGIAVVAIAAGGIGIAQAVGGDSDQQATGPEADQAKAAALKAVGGGSVVGVERQDGDGAGVYEVEVKRDDGSQVEVSVNANDQAVGTQADDEGGSGSEQGENESGQGANEEGEGGE
jgi:uncharacterized membrane protein YkoI